MVKVFASNENNDLYIASDGNLAIKTALEGVIQACEHAVKAQLGEMILAIDQGVPNFQTVWNGSPNLPQFEAYVRKAITGVAGVIEVKELQSDVVENVLVYSATIRTIYGEALVNG